MFDFANEDSSNFTSPRCWGNINDDILDWVNEYIPKEILLEEPLKLIAGTEELLNEAPPKTTTSGSCKLSGFFRSRVQSNEHLPKLSSFKFLGNISFDILDSENDFSPKSILLEEPTKLTSGTEDSLNDIGPKFTLSTLVKLSGAVRFVVKLNEA